MNKFIDGPLPIKEKDYTTFIAWFDDHYPHNLFFDAKLQVLKDSAPDYLILGGDMLNMDPFNHWAKNVPKLTKNLPIAKPYYEAANEDFFKPIREAVGEKTRIIYIFGNHEQWANKAIGMLPEGEGYFEVENNISLNFVDAFVKHRRGIALGKLWFYHGDNIPFSKNQHARKMTQYLHRSVMFGHYHDYEVHSLHVASDEEPIIGISVPCSTICNPVSYGRDLPNNRSDGFGYGEIRPDGSFDAQVALIQNGEFTFRGKRYKSKELTPRKLKYEL